MSEYSVPFIIEDDIPIDDSPLSVDELIQSEQQEYYAPCPDAQRRGGIDYQKLLRGEGGYFPDCGCYDEIYLGGIRGVRPIISKSMNKGSIIAWFAWFNLLNTLLPKTITKWSKRLIKRKIAETMLIANAAKRRLSQKTLKIKEVESLYNQILLQNVVLNNRLQTIRSQFDTLKKNKRDLQSNLVGNFENMSPEQISSIKNQIAEIDIQLNSKRIEFNSESAKSLEFKNLINSTKQEHAVLRKEHAALHDNWQKEYDNYLSAKRDLENLGASNFETIKKYIDPDGLFNLMVYAMERMSLVQRHECNTGVFNWASYASLDEKTCKCTVCPEDRELCDAGSVWINYIAGQVADIVGRPFNAALADQLNTCPEKCCGGFDRKPGLFTGGEISDLLDWAGIMDACSCECGEKYMGVGSDPIPREEKFCPNDPDACTTPNGRICVNKYPPDDPYGLLSERISGWESQFEWDSTSCDWKCKNISTSQSTYEGTLNPSGTGCLYEMTCFSGCVDQNNFPGSNFNTESLLLSAPELK